MMSCSSCGGKRLPKAPVVVIEALQNDLPSMQFSASRNTITLRNGHSEAMNRAFIQGPNKPRGGWGVKFRINGVDREFPGLNAGTVVGSILNYYRANQIPVRPVDVWLNCNLQWFERTQSKHHEAPLAELASIAGPAAETGSPQRREHPPKEWGSRAWLWLGLYLAMDDYDPEEYVAQLAMVGKMLNPNSCPSLGCQLCYSEFSGWFSGVQFNPPKTQEEAREQLVRFHNVVNSRLDKRVISFDAAARINFWL